MEFAIPRGGADNERTGVAEAGKASENQRTGWVQDRTGGTPIVQGQRGKPSLHLWAENQGGDLSEMLRKGVVVNSKVAAELSEQEEKERPSFGSKPSSHSWKTGGRGPGKKPNPSGLKTEDNKRSKCVDNCFQTCGQEGRWELGAQPCLLQHY